MISLNNLPKKSGQNKKRVGRGMLPKELILEEVRRARGHAVAARAV